MRTSSDRIQHEAQVAGLAWSLWAELGVSGWTRSHSDFGIDPEALGILTAWLRDHDPRLRDEATDWCIRYGRFISAARLKNLLGSASWLDSPWWGEFAATVNANSRWQWPAGEARPRSFKPSQKSRIGDFTRPSLIALRVRALAGVGARAEILGLLASEQRDVAVAEVAARIGYSKRNTAEALDSLEMAGLLSSSRIRNRLEYTIVDRERLSTLIDPKPRWTPSWVPIVTVITRLVEFLQRAEDLSDAVASVESVSFVRNLDDEFRWWSISPPQLVMVDDALSVLVHWAADVFAGLEAGESATVVGHQA
ncbi:MAG: winged helix-turn-helix transcriptional regulator [Actinobacteria bacterium]|nr:winged helix-turn-helix transcriptional regulator [Actinomycetota bacterium]